ncbi:hypothetical protein COV13_02895 [Candidatus Woesearchaeota archaeon CG10_big_fil_rev_8_21_14_0_10_32_9]|nr:MAG: hypothetical protein COV13_02895 [Candidatus Woesearchaeota archaeon CG10_big_fil_rev_8_21_14_0_10_32_9]
MKKTIKKMSAILAGATMIGATVLGAMAYDLSSYPSPFVTDGVFNGKLVVGEMAKPSDMLGVTDIAASLQAASKTAVAGGSGVSTTVTGGKDYDEIVLNGAWGSAVNLTDTKLSGFKDTTTRFNDDDIDYHEQLELGATAFEFQTSSDGEKDFANQVYAITDASAIEYRLYFDDYVNTSLVGSGTGEDYLEFALLGRQLTVTGVDADDYGFTVEASSEHFLKQGQEVEVAGKTVTLERVGETSVIVVVDGQRKVIASTGSATFDEADDFEVEVESIFYEQGATDNGANLKLGDSLTESAQSGQPAELFGEPDKTTEADWLWSIDLSSETAGEQYVGIVNNIDRTDLDSSEKERPALALGEELSFPNNYVSMQFYALETAYDDYQTVTLEYVYQSIDLDDDNTMTVSDGSGLILSADEQIFEVDGIETDTVYIVDNGAAAYEVWYDDGSDEVNASTTSAVVTIKVDDDSITLERPAVVDSLINFTDFTKAFNLTNGGVDAVYFFVETDNSDEHFGLLDEDEAGELQYSSTGLQGGVADIGTKDYDYMTDFGVIIPEPKSQFGSGSSFEIMVPTNQQKATLLVKTSTTSVGPSGDDSGAYTINPIPVGATILDKDAEGLVGTTPLVVVGGPFVNTISAELMGNPTTEDINAMFEPGLAKIKLYADKNAILVAGYNAQDTLGAAYVLADYVDYALTGSEVEVVVPSLQSLSVRTPTLPSDKADVPVAPVEPQTE